uniref:Uncharacterized protein n=1 Tax=Bradyrhizobium amphicarpaeae TaxID=1404768 RepID=A0A2U8Q2P5_9BRAD|nr:hypothetical protein CIT40_33080 [Bradyrhizobium amphicarpaeae]AWM04416.1 hypothetical protein CIT40_00010 [Bradyrhizobium amphicarpaeae]
MAILGGLASDLRSVVEVRHDASVMRRIPRSRVRTARLAANRDARLGRSRIWALVGKVLVTKSLVVKALTVKALGRIK